MRSERPEIRSKEKETKETNSKLEYNEELVK